MDKRLSTERSANSNADYNSASKHASSNSLDSDSKSSSLNSKQGVDTMVSDHLIKRGIYTTLLIVDVDIFLFFGI